MYDHLSKIIKELSKIYDKKSQNFFITVYLNKNQDKNYLSKRIHTCASLLKGEEKKNFNKTFKKINEFLLRNKDNNIVVFASEKHGFFKSVSLPIAINNSLIVDSSPYIRPLARIQDEWESFTLILLNSNQTKIFTIELGHIERSKNISVDIINKHKKGGWSQARFQRLRRGAIHKFYSEVIQYLEKFEIKQIVLAGPGTSKIQFRELLPKHIDQLIVGVIDVDINDEKDSIKQSLRLISEKENIASHNAVKHLKEEILKNGLAVFGIKETLTAAKNGQIDVLLVEKDYRLKGCLCEHCQILQSVPVKDCPICGGPTTEADVIEEIIEFAERTDAKIEFTDDQELSVLGHIGALLRYKESNF